ncbi:MmcQ/YjbR family DNA-binding protein [Streptomyces sp. NPDC051018]|uniref:MmcQ/YjbR family DNA-binding protein n=1 Tax=Streptomyces sp. NPDC051018 TaxID=3365639 RepID=UPI00379E303D
MTTSEQPSEPEHTTGTAPEATDPPGTAPGAASPGGTGPLPSDVLHAHCLAKPGVTFDHVFGPQTTCYRIANKIFLMVGQDADPQYATFSYDPDESLVLRATYPSVKPGYYSNKRLTNTVYYDGGVPVELTLDWVDESYAIVVAKLPRKVRDQLPG